MKIKIGKREILCDSVRETKGTLSVYQGGVEIMQISNIPDMSQIEVEGGEIEHAPTDLEVAQETIAELEERIEELTPAEDDATEEDYISMLEELGVMEADNEEERIADDTGEV